MIMSPNIHGVVPSAISHTLFTDRRQLATILDAECFDRGSDMEILTFETRSLYILSYTDGVTQGRKTKSTSHLKFLGARRVT